MKDKWLFGSVLGVYRLDPRGFIRGRTLDTIELGDRVVYCLELEEKKQLEVIAAEMEARAEIEVTLIEAVMTPFEKTGLAILEEKEGLLDGLR